MPRHPVLSRPSKDKTADLLRRASTDLWGLLTLGHFRTERHAELATAWLRSVVDAYGGFLLTFTDHLAEGLGWSESEGEAYRLRAYRMFEGETDNSLPWLIVHGARFLASHAGLPEPAPQMEGVDDNAKLARALYVVERYFDGMGRVASKAALFNEAYVAVCKYRARPPSDQFLLNLAGAAHISSDWARFGTGVPWNASSEPLSAE